MKRTIYLNLLHMTGIMLLVGILFPGGCSTAGDEPLEQLRNGFLEPPVEARPRALWDWVDGNFDPGEITSEMEEAVRMGMGGFDIWDVQSVVDEDSIMPAGPPFMSGPYVKGICHAIREAERLGLDLGLIIASGWNAGGAWTLPEHQTMGLFRSDTLVRGPASLGIHLRFPRLPDMAGKPGRETEAIIPRDDSGMPEFYREVSVIAYKKQQGSEGTISGEVIDLSDQMDPSGLLTWDVPEGKWTVVRYVCANTGQPMISHTPNSRGPMIDHFSAEASENHIHFFINKIEKELGQPVGESGLTYFYTDSYEVRGQLWTPAMTEEFESRMGYSMVPYLPALDGLIIGDRNITRRFLYDYRRVLSDLIIENHYARTREICEEHGVGFVAEAAGPGWPIHNCPFESLKSSGSLTFPRGEFWHLPSNSEFWNRLRRSERGTHYLEDLQVIKGVASASHIYDRKYVEAEAFTGTHLWNEGPGDLKPTADRAFCEGLNRINFHTWPHTPPEAGTPGWVYAFGTLVNEHRIWWPMAGPWMEYLGRCSYLLQQGNFVGDVLFYYGDSVPNFVPAKKVKPGLGFGYDYDVTNTEILLNSLHVKDGKLLLPHGQSYRVLVLPGETNMQPEILEKLEALVSDGATVVGPKPTRSHGLLDWQNRDRQVRVLADRLWGECDGKHTTRNDHGKGRIYWGEELRSVLFEQGTRPDFDFVGNVENLALDFIHRALEGIDIYFIRNTTPEPVFGTAIFRQHGKKAECWDPATGSMFKSMTSAGPEQTTRMALTLDPYGSIFVVFSGSAAEEKRDRVVRDGETVFPLEVPLKRGCNPLRIERGKLVFLEPGDYQISGTGGTVEKEMSVLQPLGLSLEGPWRLFFPEKARGPGWVEFDSLVFWNEREEDGIRFFSGVATYEKEFELDEEWTGPGRDLFLEIEQVVEVAHVYLNGTDLGISWKPPFRLEITDAVTPGKNLLKIEVANTWANGLAGDARFPPDQRRTRTNVIRLPNAWAYPMEEIPTDEYGLLDAGIRGKVKIYGCQTHKIQ